ncbi:MAG: hypothetical protein GY748_07835 [Planctomycetaceae bacterium]|nr:hypothetical protein [Planctomycetaceae bacterium]
MRSKWQKIQSRWRGFTYNFTWSDYIGFFDGWLARGALAVPIIGYLIIFNDTTVGYISFKEITNKTSILFYFEGVTRLRFLYFGLVFLGTANLIYRWRRPWVHKFGKDSFAFVEKGLEVFTPSEYINFHHTIREEGHFTLSGKYYDSEWDGFRDLAIGIEGKDKSENRPGHWNQAKSQYEYLLRNILEETFFRHSIKRRFSLSICLLVSSIGYVLLLLPSLDLFQAVIRSTFSQ